MCGETNNHQYIAFVQQIISVGYTFLLLLNINKGTNLRLMECQYSTLLMLI